MKRRYGLQADKIIRGAGIGLESKPPGQAKRMNDERTPEDFAPCRNVPIYRREDADQAWRNFIMTDHTQADLAAMEEAGRRAGEARERRIFEALVRRTGPIVVKEPPPEGKEWMKELLTPDA